MNNTKIVGFYQFNDIDKETGEKIIRYAYIEEDDREREIKIIENENEEEVKEILSKFARDKGYTKETLKDLTKDEHLKTNLSSDDLKKELWAQFGFDYKETEEKIGKEEIQEEENESIFARAKEKVILTLNKIKDAWKNNPLVRKITYTAAFIVLLTTIGLSSCKTSKDKSPTADGPKVVQPIEDEKEPVEEIKEEKEQTSTNKTTTSKKTTSTKKKNKTEDKDLGYQDPNKKLEDKKEKPKKENNGAEKENMYEKEEKPSEKEEYDQVIEVPTEDEIDIDDKYLDSNGEIIDAVDKDYSYDESLNGEMPTPEENYQNIIEEEVPVYQEKSATSNYAQVIVDAMENGQDIIYNAEDGSIRVAEPTTEENEITK